MEPSICLTGNTCSGYKHAMNISIKQFDVEMDIKNNGIELDVCTPQGNHIGDVIVNKKGLIWCRGKTTRKKGLDVTWNDFIAWMES